LEAISDFCRSLDDSPELEIVMGARVILLGHDVQRRLIRHYLGRLAATFASLAVGIRVYDAMCGAKCFRVTARTVALFSQPFRSRWVFDVEWLARFVNDGGWPTRAAIGSAVCELPLRQWREVPGSKLRFRDLVRAVFDLTGVFSRYRWRVWRGKEPLTHSVESSPRAAENMNAVSAFHQSINVSLGPESVNKP
jgi:dolichyl-phosphate beta-glucosyltransferase